MRHSNLIQCYFFCGWTRVFDTPASHTKKQNKKESPIVRPRKVQAPPRTLFFCTGQVCSSLMTRVVKEWGDGRARGGGGSAKVNRFRDSLCRKCLFVRASRCICIAKPTQLKYKDESIPQILVSKLFVFSRVSLYLNGNADGEKVQRWINSAIPRVKIVYLFSRLSASASQSRC